MSAATSDGSLTVFSESILELQEGFSSEKGDDGKDSFWCSNCPYFVKSGTKAAIKRHITSKHATRVVTSPLPKSGTKRTASVEVGDDDLDDKRPKIGDLDDDDNDLNEELSNVAQSTQIPRQPDLAEKTNLNEMLDELEQLNGCSEQTYEAVIDESTFGDANETTPEKSGNESEFNKTVINVEAEVKTVDSETDIILLKAKIASLTTESMQKDISMTDKENELIAVKSELANAIDDCNKLKEEEDKKVELIDTLTAQNESLKDDIKTKDATISRCTEVVRNVRNQIKEIKSENENLKKNPNKTTDDQNDKQKLKKVQEEVKVKNTKIRQLENDKKLLANSITNLEEEVNNLKKNSTDKLQKVSSTSRDTSSKLKAVQEENNTLKSNLSQYQKEINEKNGKISQLDNMNTRLNLHNKHLTEICIKNNLFDVQMEEENEVTVDSDDSVSDSHENKKSRKCYFFEQGKCSKVDCGYIHAKKVCKKYNEGNCQLGSKCKDSHPRLNCRYWLRGNCNKEEKCQLRHLASKKNSKSPIKLQNFTQNIINRKDDKDVNPSNKKTDIENLVNAVKEGFKEQNHFLANTLRANPGGGQNLSQPPKMNPRQTFNVPPPTQRPLIPAYPHPVQNNTTLQSSPSIPMTVPVSVHQEMQTNRAAQVHPHVHGQAVQTLQHAQVHHPAQVHQPPHIYLPTQVHQPVQHVFSQPTYGHGLPNIH